MRALKLIQGSVLLEKAAKLEKYQIQRVKAWRHCEQLQLNLQLDPFSERIAQVCKTVKHPSFGSTELPALANGVGYVYASNAILGASYLVSERGHGLFDLLILSIIRI